jgi:antirestriction protein ArdC
MEIDRPWQRADERGHEATLLRLQRRHAVDVCPTNRYVTFKQALEAGGSVRKGEHGTKVYFVSTFEAKQDDTDDPGSGLL